MNFEKTQNDETSPKIDDTWQKIDQLLNTYKPGLLAAANKFVKDYHLNLEGEDLYVETAYRINDHFSTYDKSKNFYGWAERVMKNLAIDKARRLKNKPIPVSLDSLIALNQIGQAEDVVSNLEAKQLLEKVLDIIENILPRNQQIMILHLQGELSCDIAKKLNISPAQVSKSLFSTRKIIKTQLKLHGFEINI